MGAEIPYKIRVLRWVVKWGIIEVHAVSESDALEKAGEDPDVAKVLGVVND